MMRSIEKNSAAAEGLRFPLYNRTLWGKFKLLTVETHAAIYVSF